MSQNQMMVLIAIKLNFDWQCIALGGGNFIRTPQQWIKGRPHSSW